jgi:hypothetical protein
MLLRSMMRDFNSSVFRGPDNEGGSDAGNDTVPADNGTGDDTGVDSGTGDGGEEAPKEPLTVREQIKKSIAETSGEPAPKAKRGKSGRYQAGGEPKDGDEPPAVGEGDEPPAPPVEEVPLPDGFPKELKTEWDKAPAAIKTAMIKRVQDMTAGVEQLKQRYSLIDKAIEPHTDALRQMNATPADAVDRMFLWFKALAGSPEHSFPALAKSMGIDWAKLAPGATAPVPGTVDPAGAQPGGAPEIPEPIRQYVGQLEGHVRQLTEYVQQIGGRFGNVEQNINTQNEARTRENLALWSSGKEFFEEVRADMAKLIETGVIPLKADGQVDLDTAYERAIYFNPDVRVKVLAKQQQADTQVQQQSKEAATTAQTTQAAKARKAAGGSLPATTTPGTPGANGSGKGKPGQKLSVRDSLKASIAQLRDQ